MTVIMTATPTTPTSPLSPKRKRRSLRIPSIQSCNESLSPITYQFSRSDIPTHSRKSSQSSFLQYSPVAQRPTSSRSKRPSSSRLSIGSNISAGLSSNAGLGNLADELEEVWDSDFEGGDNPFLQEFEEDESTEILHSPIEMKEQLQLDTRLSPRSPKQKNLLKPPEKPPSPSKQWASMGTQHKTESLYDGSDYGPSSDDEAFDSIPPTLQRRIHDFEEITRISTNADALSESGGVIPRTLAALKNNLGAQANAESRITKLITAYTSMATHRTHQTREVQNISHSFTNPGPIAASFFDLPSETIDLLITELDSLEATLPFLPTASSKPTSMTPLIALQSFGNETYDLIVTLQGLTDTLIEHRQHILAATRRLKSVRELAEDLITEEELVETSMMLIQAGDWDRRCRERHASKIVGEVLEDFKNTWDVDYVEGSWRPGGSTRRAVAVQ